VPTSLRKFVLHAYEFSHWDPYCGILVSPVVNVQFVGEGDTSTPNIGPVPIKKQIDTTIRRGHSGDVAVLRPTKPKLRVLRADFRE
jgi:hypothetical protein